MGSSEPVCLLPRRPLADGTVRALLVVVGNVLAKDCVEVATPEDEHPVKALRRARCIQSVQRPRWRTPSTTPGRDVPDVFVVVHPFHPLLGQSFELVVKGASSGSGA